MIAALASGAALAPAWHVLFLWATAHPRWAQAIVAVSCAAPVVGFLDYFFNDLFDQLGGWGFSGGGGGGDPATIILWEVVSGIEAFLGALVASLTAAFTVIGHYFTQIGGIFGALRKFLGMVWKFLGKLTIGNIIAWIKRAQGWLHDKLQPLIDLIKRYRKMWDDYYRKHVLPIINLIQKVRRYLLVLRLLHIHWADKLDAYLLKEEQYLNRYFLEVRSFLNQALSLATLATNPISLGRMVLISACGRRSVGALARAITGLPLGHFFPSTSIHAFAWEKQPTSLSSYTDIAQNPPPSEILSPLLSDFAGGSFEGDYGPTDEDIDAVAPLAWGDEFISTLKADLDGADARPPGVLSLWQSVSNQTGDLHDAATAESLVATP